jgi:hypothetical protein
MMEDASKPPTAEAGHAPSVDHAKKIETSSSREQVDQAQPPSQPEQQEKPHHVAGRPGGLHEADGPKPDPTTGGAAGPGNETPGNVTPAGGTPHPAALTPASERFAALTSTTAQAASPTTTAAVPIAGLAVEIAARAQAGINRFEIRLDPPDLGRIDVRLDVDRSGQVTSRLVVERAETLEVLRRDAGELERALQQAGLKTSDNGLQFSLRDQSFAGYDQQNPSSAARLVVPDPELAPIEAVPANSYGRTLSVAGGIDIRV